jgi:hypothetical protein
MIHDITNILPIDIHRLFAGQERWEEGRKEKEIMIASTYLFVNLFWRRTREYTLLQECTVMRTIFLYMNILKEVGYPYNSVVYANM